MGADIACMQKRLKAILAYDGIKEADMPIQLAKVLSVSLPVAKRMLNGEHRTIIKRGFSVCDAMNVEADWFFCDRIDRGYRSRESHLRTLRINMQSYKGYPKAITDKAMRFNFAYIAGVRKAENLMSFVLSKKMNYVDAVMTF